MSSVQWTIGNVLLGILIASFVALEGLTIKRWVSSSKEHKTVELIEKEKNGEGEHTAVPAEDLPVAVEENFLEKFPYLDLMESGWYGLDGSSSLYLDTENVSGISHLLQQLKDVRHVGNAEFSMIPAGGDPVTQGISPKTGNESFMARCKGWSIRYIDTQDSWIDYGDVFLEDIKGNCHIIVPVLTKNERMDN